MNSCIIGLLFLLFLMSCSHGQELSLDRDVSLVSGQTPLCGILFCEAVSAAFGPSDNCQGKNNVSFMSILSMRLFHRPLNKGKRTKLVELNQQTPSMSGATYGFSMAGYLETGGASLQLDLVKEKNCLSEFTCEVQGVDEAGKEVISSVTLLPQPAQAGGGNQASSGGLMSAVSLQLLNQVQQLNTKLSVLANSMDGWEEKSDAVEKYMAEKIATTERQLEEKIESLDGKLDQSVDRIEDKVDNDVLDKLNLLDLKLLTSIGQGQTLQAKQEADSILPCNLTTLREELQNEQKETFENLTTSCMRLEWILNSTAELLFSIQNNLSEANACEDLGSLIISNLTEQLKEVIIIDSWSNKNSLESILAAHENLSLSLEAVEEAIVAEANETRTQLKHVTTSLGEQASTNETCDMPKSCHEGMTSVFYEGSYPYPVIVPSEESDLAVPYLCDTSTDGGGWIIIQRRATGETNFTRDWESYKQGFGTLCSDFWLGNDNIHTLTSKGTWELRVDIQYKDKSAYAHYAYFFIDDEEEEYRLSVGKYSGSAGDSLISQHNGRRFTTFDNDNDHKSGRNCVSTENGAWWFRHCDSSNLNGEWGAGDDEGVEWSTFVEDESLTFSEMKIRQVQ